MSTDNKDLQATSVSTSEIEVSLSKIEDEEALVQEAHEVIANAIVKNEVSKTIDDSEAALGADNTDAKSVNTTSTRMYQKDPTILISRESQMGRQIQFALNRLRNDETVTFSAFNINVKKAIQMVEIIKRRIGFLHQESSLCHMEYKEKKKIKVKKPDTSEQDPDDKKDDEVASGDELREFTRRVTGMKIKLSKLPLDDKAVGYQKPKPRDNYQLPGSYRKRSLSTKKKSTSDLVVKKDSKAASKPSQDKKKRPDSDESKRDSRAASSKNRRQKSSRSKSALPDSKKSKSNSETLVIVKDDTAASKRASQKSVKKSQDKTDVKSEAGVAERKKARNSNKERRSKSKVENKDEQKSVDQKQQPRQRKQKGGAGKEDLKENQQVAKGASSQYDNKSERGGQNYRQQPQRNGYYDQFYRQPPYYRGGPSEYDQRRQYQQQRPYDQRPFYQGNQGYPRRPLQMYNGSRPEGVYNQQQRPLYSRDRPGFFPGSGKQFKTERQPYGLDEREARDNKYHRFNNQSNGAQGDFQNRRTRSKSQTNAQASFNDTKSEHSTYTQNQPRRTSGVQKQLRV